jgi:hypothetical protein
MRALVIVLLVLPHLAFADDRAKAEQYFSAGEQAYRQQSFGAAAEQFELAYAALPLPEIAFSAAQAYRRQYFVDPKPEYVKRAVELYRIYLAKVKTGGRVADASDGVAEMQRELDRLVDSGAKIGAVKRDATRIAVSVSAVGDRRSTLTELSAMPATTQTGAKATLDGKPLELFAPVVCTPGPHTVEVTADGYVSVRETRQVIEGSTELVEVKLEPLPAHLAITTDAGATISIDGHAFGIAPLAEQQLPAGTHTIAVTRRGRLPVERSIVIKRGEHAAIHQPLAMTGRRKLVPWVGVATGVLAAAAITTTVLAVHYDHEMASLDAERLSTGITTSQLVDYRSDVRARDDLRDVSLALGGATIVAAAVTAALYYFDLPTLGEHAIVPAATPNGAGVSLTGRF